MLNEAHTSSAAAPRCLDHHLMPLPHQGLSIIEAVHTPSLPDGLAVDLHHLIEQTDSACPMGKATYLHQILSSWHQTLVHPYPNQLGAYILIPSPWTASQEMPLLLRHPADFVGRHPPHVRQVFRERCGSLLRRLNIIHHHPIVILSHECRKETQVMSEQTRCPWRSQPSTPLFPCEHQVVLRIENKQPFGHYSIFDTKIENFLIICKPHFAN